MIYIKIGLLSMLLTLLVGNGYSQEVVEKYEFFGNERFDDDQLQTWSGLKEGFAVNLSIINAANQKIITGYQEAGYLFARIDSTVLSSEDKKKGSRGKPRLPSFCSTSSLPGFLGSGFAYTKHLSSAHWAFTLSCRTFILHYDRLWVLDFPLGPTFHTICLHSDLPLVILATAYHIITYRSIGSANNSAFCGANSPQRPTVPQKYYI